MKVCVLLFWLNYRPSSAPSKKIAHPALAGTRFWPKCRPAEGHARNQRARRITSGQRVLPPLFLGFYLLLPLTCCGQTQAAASSAAAMLSYSTTCVNRKFSGEKALPLRNLACSLLGANNFTA
jgi:hypothetical protein